MTRREFRIAERLKVTSLLPENFILPCDSLKELGLRLDTTGCAPLSFTSRRCKSVAPFDLADHRPQTGNRHKTSREKRHSNDRLKSIRSTANTADNGPLDMELGSSWLSIRTRRPQDLTANLKMQLVEFVGIYQISDAGVAGKYASPFDIRTFIKLVTENRPRLYATHVVHSKSNNGVEVTEKFIEVGKYISARNPTG